MALDLLTGIDGNVILPLIIAFHVSYFTECGFVTPCKDGNEPSPFASLSRAEDDAFHRADLRPHVFPCICIEMGFLD